MTVCVYSPGEAPTVGARTRQEPNMTSRRTSAYSLRVATPDGPQNGYLDLIKAAALPIVGIITDSHVYAGGVSVGFRAADDTAALKTGARVIASVANVEATWELQTGHGIHRRTISSGHRRTEAARD